MSLRRLLRVITGTVAKGTPAGQILSLLAELRGGARPLGPSSRFYIIYDRRRHKVVAHLKGTRKFIIYQLKKEAKAVNRAYFDNKYEVVAVDVVLSSEYNNLLSFIA